LIEINDGVRQLGGIRRDPRLVAREQLDRMWVQKSQYCAGLIIVSRYKIASLDHWGESV